MFDLSPQDLLLRRAREGSQLGARTDGAHLALVLEGGGMRGVVSIGLACAFEEAGLLGAFDSVHGSSAGACAAAYFAAGQSVEGGSIYYEDINNRQFISLARPLIGRPVMNRPFLVDEIIAHKKRLRTEVLLNRPNYFNVVLTDAETGECEVIREFQSRDEVLSALRATINIPFVAGVAEPFRGRHYVDGGVVQQIAVPSALDVGATHIICLMTRREHELRRKDRTKGFSLEALALRFGYGARFEELFRQRNTAINAILDCADTGFLPTGQRIDSLAPSRESADLKRLTTNGPLLRQAFFDALHVGRRYLGELSS